MTITPTSGAPSRRKRDSSSPPSRKWRSSDTACLYNDNYCHVASFIDNDLTGIYKVNDHLTTSVTVENLMDRAPPIDPANYAGLNYNPTYHQAGIIGRYFKLGVGYKF